MGAMKLATTLLILAGSALAYIAWSAREPIPADAHTAGEPPASLSGEVPADHVVRTFEVEGICCGGCGSKLYGSLVALDDVREAAVDIRAGVVEVIVPRQLEVAELEGALTFDKYSARLRP